jgi:phage-related protein
VNTDDETDQAAVKPLEWVRSARADLIDFPEAVRKEVGYGLYLAQTGSKALNAKPLRGFGGTGVVEIVVQHEGSAYRGVYTVKFAHAVYVLHCFQKKSKHGIKTPQTEIDLIKRRLLAAAEHYQKEYVP